MNILLTGATGFLGFRVLEKLVKLPYVNRILATGRTMIPYRKIIDSKVTYLFGDLENESFVNSLFDSIDIIINCASLSAPWGNKNKFVAANIQTQTNLIAAANIKKVSKFIYISSPSIYYNGEDRLGIKESDSLPKKFVNQYARTKFEAEQLLVNSLIPYIILRPRALIGRGDSVIMPRLINAFDQGRLRVIGNGQNMVDLTSVSNVADAIVLSLLAKETALNHAFNISNGEPVNLWEHINCVLAALNKNLGVKKVPFLIADSFAHFLEIKSRLTDNKEPTLTRYGVGTLAKSFTLDINKAKNLLNYNPNMNTEASVNEFINWYKNYETL